MEQTSGPAPARAARIWERATLRDDGDRHRPVGWVELFFDLVFVVIIAVLAHDLGAHLSVDALVRFALQFMAVFWVWNAFTYYTERFESQGLENRLFAFIAILAVAGLAIWGEDGLGHNYPGFAASYLLARCLNIGMWVRAGRHERRFRPAALSFVGGFAVAATLLAVSFAVSEEARLVLWGLAVVAEIATPAVASRLQAGLPQISRDKFPERFGLLTMIVLGETIAGVIRGVATANEEAQLSAFTIVDAGLGLAIGFGMWWVYFDFIARRPSKPSFNAALIWVYLHIITLTGIVLVGVAVAEALVREGEGDGRILGADVASLLLVGLGLTLVAVAFLETYLDRAPDEPTHPVVSPALKVAVGAALAVVGALAPPLTVTAAFAIALVGLAIPAAYGAAVYYRPRNPTAGNLPTGPSARHDGDERGATTETDSHPQVASPTQMKTNSDGSEHRHDA